MGIHSHFDKLIKKGEKLEQKAKDFSGFEDDVYAYEVAISNFRREYEEDESVDEAVLEDLMEQLWEQRHEATSWLPSSYQC